MTRNSDGSAFHSLGPQTEKEVSPYDFILHRGRFSLQMSLIASVEERRIVLRVLVKNCAKT